MNSDAKNITPQDGSQQSRKQLKRAATVLDSIQMTRFSGVANDSSVAEFSPDGRRFVTVIRKGDLNNNANVYSLIMFNSSEALNSPTPRTLLELSSTSNRPAISNVKWLDDNETLMFLGEQPGEKRQLYVLDCRTGELTTLVAHNTSLVSYDVSARHDMIAFLADSPAKSMLDEKVIRNGLIISSQRLPDIVSGQLPEGSRLELYVKPTGVAAKQIWVQDEIFHHPGVSVSPDGKYAIVRAAPVDAPTIWTEYQDHLIQTYLTTKRPKGVATWVWQHLLVNTDSGATKALVDAPNAMIGGLTFWSEDSESVVLANTYLPLTVDDPVERKLRETANFCVEVNIASGEFLKIASDQYLQPIKWDATTNTVFFQHFGSQNSSAGSTVAYHKTGSQWNRVEDAHLEANAGVEVIVSQDMNTPPQMFAVKSATNQRSLLLDPNPQLREIALAHVEEIIWKATDGREVRGGLYLPPDYQQGTRCPLVIQTHGWTPKLFCMDGSPFSTAFAAQALASEGFVVAQANGSSDLMTVREGPQEMASYEGLIDHLDARGVIDRDRVGLIGFSRTCFHVKYALTGIRYRRTDLD